jgi:hypothetical protein
MKTRVKNVILMAILWSLLIITGAYSQQTESQVNISIGWKSGEVSLEDR